jgi:hypothetical protein
MAADWIKMRVDLFTHPKVVRISSALKADTLRTIGGLMSAWCLFDAHSLDGSLDGYTSETLDAHLRWPGFAAAMIAVGWLEDNGQALVLPEFDTHNGASAKRRAQDADRKKNVRKMSASEADELRTRKEKKREEIKAITPTPNGAGQAMVVDAYHEALPACVRWSVLTPKRAKAIAAAEKNAKAVCKARGWEYGADFWRDYFAECAKDPWYRGDVPNPKNPAWRQSLDVLLRDDHFGKVMDKALGQAA